MHLRALIVLLLAMNLGVALWWAVRPSPGPAPAPQLPADVPRLQLVSEAEPGVLEAAALNAANANVQAEGPLADTEEEEAATAAAAEDLRCFSFGPWAEAAGAEAALDALRVRTARIRGREVLTGASGWRVMLPPQADRPAAQAIVARLVDAGFDDHFIIGSGEEANAIALGRFGAEDSARRHAAALRAAGFEAEAGPVGVTGSERWLDVAAGAGFDPDAARAAAGAERVAPLDCALVQ